MPIAQPAPQWSEVEIALTADAAPSDAYERDVEVTFRHDSGALLARPAFWDGGATWRVRFASPLADGRWRWTAQAPGLGGIDGATGALAAAAADATAPAWRRHGLLRMGRDATTVVHADGTPWLLCADTPWALPWRATPDDCRRYARTREAQGFNAALLMSIQPDLRRPTGRRRGAAECWDEGFDDLADGRLRRLRPEYFRALDELAGILLAHGIVPVWQPVFHGFGFRGGAMGGREVPPAEYARYCRYLVARYGARPALWLVGADGQGTEPTVAAGGAAIEACDAYGQPTGIHYAPHAGDDAHQDAAWLDFQWCQTGHTGEHRPERLASMAARRPIKAIANGEPTYERIGRADRATGWWQGEEAWRNLCAGAAMGVVYGAGSLWQWRPTRDEPHGAWACAEDCDWRDALRFPGAAHVGRLRTVLAEIDLAGAQPDFRSTHGRPALLDPGRLLIVYLHQGGGVDLIGERVPPRWRAVDLLTGEVVASGVREGSHSRLALPAGAPLAVICQA